MNVLVLPFLSVSTTLVWSVVGEVIVDSAGNVSLL